MQYKLVLKRKGRYKKPFYAVTIVNNKSRIVEKIGSLNLNFNNTIKKKKLQINIFLFYRWIVFGLKPSYFLLKFLKILHIF
jgi:ribosomal protein S16